MSKAGDQIGREIVEAAEREVAKRFPAVPRRHWRRHDECVVESYDTHLPNGTVSGHGAHAVNATACGRLASHNDTTTNGEETDCRECAEVYFVVNPPGYVHSGV